MRIKCYSFFVLFTFGVTKTFSTCIHKPKNHFRTAITPLIDGCGIREGLGGAVRRTLLKRTKKNNPQSKVISGGWLISKNLFSNVDFSPEVRLKSGEMNPSWTSLVTLRSAFSILKTKEWSKFFVVPSSSVTSTPGCADLRRNLEEQEEKDEEIVDEHNSPNNHNQSRRFLSRTHDSPQGVALYPWQGGDQYANLRTVCSLIDLFAFVVVGTCHQEESDAVRRQIALRLKNDAVQHRTSKRVRRKGSVVVLTIPKCSSELQETGLGLLRLSQSLLTKPPSNTDSYQSAAFDWTTKSEYIFYLHGDRSLVSSREVVDGLVSAMLANSCSAVVPSFALLTSCETDHGMKGSRFQITTGNTCPGQTTINHLQCDLPPGPQPSQPPISKPSLSLTPSPTRSPLLSHSTSPTLNRGSPSPSMQPHPISVRPTSHIPTQTPTSIPDYSPPQVHPTPSPVMRPTVADEVPLFGHLVGSSKAPKETSFPRWLFVPVLVCYALVILCCIFKFYVNGRSSPLVYATEVFDKPLINETNKKPNTPRRRIVTPHPTPFNMMYTADPEKQKQLDDNHDTPP